MTVFSENGRMLVVVAHPDDETFGCGSLLLHAAAAGMSTVVCCATRGEAGEWPADIALPAGGIGELREGELRAAAGTLGVARVDVLGLRRLGPGTARPRRATLVARNRARVAASLGAVIDGSSRRGGDARRQRRPP